MSKQKKLKRARSQAELQAVKQRWLQIILTSISVMLTLLVLLHSYDLI